MKATVTNNSYEWILTAAERAIFITDGKLQTPNSYESFIEVKFAADDLNVTQVFVVPKGSVGIWLLPTNLTVKDPVLAKLTHEKLRDYNNNINSMYSYAGYIDYAGYRFTCTIHNYVDIHNIGYEISEFVRNDLIGRDDSELRWLEHIYWGRQC